MNDYKLTYKISVATIANSCWQPVGPIPVGTMYRREASLALLVPGVLASPFLPHVCFRSSPRTALTNHVFRTPIM